MPFRKAPRTAILVACLAWLGHFSAPALASVVVGATRVIYPAGEPEVTLRLTNDGAAPALVQTWVDSGDANEAPSSVKVPFIVTPPVSRIDPSKSQTLRIIHTGEPLATNRESVFWLNVLEVPPKPSDAEAGPNRIQMAFRSRIKLFFRPADLDGKPADAPGKLTWRLVTAQGRPAVEVSNPSSFHVSLTEIRAMAGDRSAVYDLGGMVGPGGTQVFALNGDLPETADMRVRFSTLNDYGGEEVNEAPLPSSSSSRPLGR